MAAAMLLLLGLSAPARTPDLQVEARTTSGANASELADAVARALVAGGARVVWGGRTTEPCLRCAHVTVVELDPGRYRIEVRQDQRVASTTLQLSANNSVFDTARAIAIQARLLVPAQPISNSSDKDVAAHRAGHKAGLRGEENQSTPSPLTRPIPPTTDLKTPAPPHPAAPVASGVANARLPSQEPGNATPKADEVASAKPSEAPTRLSTEVRGEARSSAVPRPLWPWIPTALGAGSAVGAAVCAIVARNRYDALSDHSRPLQQAVQLKNAGENWQTASLVLSGTAVVGLTLGLVGFFTRSSRDHSVGVSAGLLRDGGMIAIVGDLP